MINISTLLKKEFHTFKMPSISSALQWCATITKKIIIINKLKLSGIEYYRSYPCLSAASIVAPARRRYSQVSWNPPKAALLFDGMRYLNYWDMCPSVYYAAYQCNGERPSWSSMSTVAPASRRTMATLASPASQARNRGVWYELSMASTLAPCYWEKNNIILIMKIRKAE